MKNRQVVFVYDSHVCNLCHFVQISNFRMPAYGLNPSIDLEGCIRSLPANVFIKIRETLDRNPADRDWRALVRAVDQKYEIK